MWGYQAISAASNKLGIGGIEAGSKVVSELIRQMRCPGRRAGRSGLGSVRWPAEGEGSLDAAYQEVASAETGAFF